MTRPQGPIERMIFYTVGGSVLGMSIGMLAWYAIMMALGTAIMILQFIGVRIENIHALGNVQPWCLGIGGTCGGLLGVIAAWRESRPL